MEYWWCRIYIFQSRITLLSLNNNNNKKKKRRVDVKYRMEHTMLARAHILIGVCITQINTQINWWIKMSKGQNCNFRNEKRGSNSVLFRHSILMCVCLSASGSKKPYIQIKLEIFLPSYHHFHVLFNRIFSGISATRLIPIYLFLVPTPLHLHSKFAQIQNSMAMSNSTTYNCCIMPEVLCLCVYGLSFFLLLSLVRWQNDSSA